MLTAALLFLVRSSLHPRCKFTTFSGRTVSSLTSVAASETIAHASEKIHSMPRFLNTYTGEFEWHDNPARVRYAILSHTWRSAADGGEQSLEDVKKLQSASFVPAQRHEVGSQSETLSDSPRLLRPTLDPYVPDHTHSLVRIFTLWAGKDDVTARPSPPLYEDQPSLPGRADERLPTHLDRLVLHRQGEQR